MLEKARKCGERLIILSLIIIIFLSGSILINMFLNYAKDRAYYDELRNQKEEVDWETLKKINSQVVAWLKLKNTSIDYPVVQAEDNKKYLNTLFDGSYGQAGTLFVDYRNNNPFNGTNTIIYGHRMNDNTMFNCLSKYEKKSFLDNHEKFELKTPEDEYELRVKAFLKVKYNSTLYKNNIDDMYSKENWLSEISKEAIYVVGELNIHSKYVMLSTCVKHEKDMRYLVLCEIS